MPVTAQELTKIGAKNDETEDGMIITGTTPLHAAAVDSYGDHRIGMRLQVDALLVKEGTVNLAHPEAVNISFPSFFDDLVALSA